MTGYGKADIVSENYKLNVEIKSVNHRYLDLSIKMPKRFNMYESMIRNLVRDYVQRGKVDIYITFEDYSKSSSSLKYNSKLAKEYVEFCEQMQAQFGLVNDVKVSTLARFPEVLTMEDISNHSENDWEMLSEAIKEVCKGLIKSKEQEGENLKKDILAKLEYMLNLLLMIEERAPQIIEEYKLKLRDKVKDLLENNSLDEGRIASEVVIYADKICLDEEIVRLHSHINATERELKKGGSVGRKLDFIAQELNREANTILSKTGDSLVAETAISLKTEIEKVREQIQNIE
jgi:TIGR00255 family protein